jgi:hypothetical protein
VTLAEDDEFLDLNFRNRQGEHIGLTEYFRLVKIKGYHLVGQVRVGNIKVSTIWLGTPHPLDIFDDESYYFELMMFYSDLRDPYQTRFRTEYEALMTFLKIVAILRLRKELPCGSR